MRVLRNLRFDELETLLDWAAAEGWNPGLADAGSFWAADPEGFIGAFVGNTMVAAIAAVAYGDSFGFIGLYICAQRWRGQGHGKAVWDAAMERLGKRTIGLDGVPAQQGNYRRMGFVPAYQTVRMSGALPPPVGNRALRGTIELPAVAKLDALGFCAPRPDFLRQWLAPPNQPLLIWEGGTPVGYAVCRPCQSGRKVGPLFAPSQHHALQLLEGFGGPVQIDVPLEQQGFVAALVERGFSPGFQTARMYRGPAPGVGTKFVFGTTSLELG